MKMSHLLSALIAGFLALMTSCASMTPLETSSARNLAKDSIFVVESEDVLPKFSIIGTTVFNNKSELIYDRGFSFTDHLVAKLKSRGYNAQKLPSGQFASMTAGLALTIYPIHPYQMEGLIGLGFHQRKFLGLEGEVLSHCNFCATLVDKKSRRRLNQPIDWLGANYCWAATGIKRNVDDWEDFSIAEKHNLQVLLQKHMDKCSTSILDQLGL
jgi:hypothetical protein